MILFVQNGSETWYNIAKKLYCILSQSDAKLKPIVKCVLNFLAQTASSDWFVTVIRRVVIGQMGSLWLGVNAVFFAAGIRVLRTTAAKETRIYDSYCIIL